jgi:hypothetical protein
MHNESFKTINPSEIAIAHKRIAPYIHKTPILSSSILN